MGAVDCKTAVNIAANSALVILSQTTAYLKGPAFLARSAAVCAFAVLHLVQHLSSKNCSVSTQWSGGHMTPLHATGSALLFIPTPPVSDLVQERSSGTMISSDQQVAQQPPFSSFDRILKGGPQSRLGAQVICAQGSCPSCSRRDAKEAVSSNFIDASKVWLLIASCASADASTHPTTAKARNAISSADWDCGGGNSADFG